MRVYKTPLLALTMITLVSTISFAGPPERLPGESDHEWAKRAVQHRIEHVSPEALEREKQQFQAAAKRAEEKHEEDRRRIEGSGPTLEDVFKGYGRVFDKLTGAGRALILGRAKAAWEDAPRGEKAKAFFKWRDEQDKYWDQSFPRK